MCDFELPTGWCAVLKCPWVCDFKCPPRHEADDYISDLVLDADYQAELEYDAFESDISRMKYLLWHAGQTEHVEIEHFEEPSAPKTKSTGPLIFDVDPASIKAHIAALEAADVHGTKAVLRLRNGPVLFRKVPMRAVGDWFSARMISEKIATYLVLRQACRLLGLDLADADK